MTDKNYREHFEDFWIKREMNKKSLSYIHAQQELRAWKKNNRKEYNAQYDEYVDEIKGF